MFIAATIYIIAVSIQFATAAKFALTNPGTTVTLPNDAKQGSGQALSEHFFQGEPCQAFQKENNPVSAQTGKPTKGIVC